MAHAELQSVRADNVELFAKLRYFRSGTGSAVADANSIGTAGGAESRSVAFAPSAFASVIFCFCFLFFPQLFAFRYADEHAKRLNPFTVVKSEASSSSSQVRSWPHCSYFVSLPPNSKNETKKKKSLLNPAAEQSGADFARHIAVAHGQPQRAAPGSCVGYVLPIAAAV